ncbi:MAG: NAD(P)H-dependent glycerol-3-phosphate dehydrogenase [Gammaproteobacteria bacterium]
MSDSQPICVVIGAGAWGSALALHLARGGHETRLWSQDPAHLEVMQASRKNVAYLGDYEFPKNLQVINALATAVDEKTIFLIAVPSAGFISTLQLIKTLPKPPAGIVIATKGLTEGGAFLSSQVNLILPAVPYGVLSGPSFAKELAENLPTAVTFAAEDPLFRNQVVSLFHHNSFRVYESEDVIGVSLGGCIKNVLAIAVGISDGLGFGANARAALITRGLAEMMRLGAALQADPKTFMGLAGLGDLVLTCTDNQSRNRRFGLYLGEGKSIEEAHRLIQRAIEGYKNARQVSQLAKQYQVEMPICEVVYQILYESLSSQKAMAELMRRAPTYEH